MSLNPDLSHSWDDGVADIPRDQLPKMDENVVYSGYRPPVAPSAASFMTAPSLVPSDTGRGLVESGVTLDVMGRGGWMTSVRRTFILFTLFDLVLIFILWAIYTQLMGEKGFLAFDQQVNDYDFKTSLFDTVLLACFRFTFIVLAYALFRLRHWAVVAVTTGLSSAFLIVKIFVFKFSDTNSNNNPLSYCLIIVSFVLAWVETWFLDFKVLPQEKKMEERMGGSASRRGYGSTSRYDGTYRRIYDDMQSVITEDHQFYSPLGSPEGSDDEDGGERGQRTQAGGSSKENDYIRLAKHSMDILWTYANSPEDDWKQEAGVDDMEGIVHSKKIKGVGKVFRTKGVVNFNAKELYEDITLNVEDMPGWNPTMKEQKILQKVDNIVDVLYSVSSEIAGGVISSRDFITVRCLGERDGVFLSSGMAVNHPDKPPQKQYVRGVNGAGGFMYKPHEDDPDNKCRFTWFMNTDIKGWFPQKLIDANMSKVGLDFLVYLHAHIEEVKGNKGVMGATGISTS